MALSLPTVGPYEIPRGQTKDRTKSEPSGPSAMTLDPPEPRERATPRAPSFPSVSRTRMEANSDPGAPREELRRGLRALRVRAVPARLVMLSAPRA